MKDGKTKQNKTKYKSQCKIKHSLCLARENGLKGMHERSLQSMKEMSCLR